MSLKKLFPIAKLLKKKAACPLITVNKLKKNGKEPILRFSKWTLTEDMVAEHQYGKKSFKEYIQNGQ